eukprot:6207280-Pleurochrysis_carterae.AAC.1
MRASHTAYTIFMREVGSQMSHRRQMIALCSSTQPTKRAPQEIAKLKSELVAANTRVDEISAARGALETKLEQAEARPQASAFSPAPLKLAGQRARLFPVALKTRRRLRSSSLCNLRVSSHRILPFPSVLSSSASSAWPPSHDLCTQRQVAKYLRLRQAACCLCKARIFLSMLGLPSPPECKRGRLRACARDDPHALAR